MRIAFGIALLAGVVALIVWVGARGLGIARFDPEERFGVAGRRVVGAMVAFGMGGLSAAYAGWNLWLAVAAAVAVAALTAWYVGAFGGGERG